MIFKIQILALHLYPPALEQKLATLYYDAEYTPLLQGTVTQQCFFTSYYIVQQVKRSVFQDDEMEMCYTSSKGSASSSAMTTQSFVVVAFALQSLNRKLFLTTPLPTMGGNSLRTCIHGERATGTQERIGTMSPCCR